jgi:outer membrane protein assembly factor BamB
MSLLLGACNWSMWRYGPTGTGYNPFENAIGRSNVGTLTQAWSAPIGSTGSDPVVANGVLYVASDPSGPLSKLFAFDAAGAGCAGSPTTCSPLWTADVGNDTMGDSPAVANGFVYIGGSDGTLYVFDAAGNTGCSGTPKTCTPLWTAEVGGTLGASAVVAGSIVYIGGANTFYAFDANGSRNCSGVPKTCAALWTANVGVATAAAVANGMVYIASFNDERLYAFDASGHTNCTTATPRTCTPLWFGGTGPVTGAPAIANGFVYLAEQLGSAGELAAYDASGINNCSSGPPTKACNPVWAGQTPVPLTTAPAVANGVVYVHSGGTETMYVYDATGSTNCGVAPPGATSICPPLWTAETVFDGGGQATSPSVANGVVYLGNDDHNVYAFDAAGTMNCADTPIVCHSIWTAATGGAISSSPTIVNGKVYVVSSDGNLYAYALPVT